MCSCLQTVAQRPCVFGVPSSHKSDVGIITAFAGLGCVPCTLARWMVLVDSRAPLGVANCLSEGLDVESLTVLAEAVAPC